MSERDSTHVRLSTSELETIYELQDGFTGENGARVPMGSLIARACRLMIQRRAREVGAETWREWKRRGRVRRLGFDPYAPEASWAKPPEFNPDTVVKGKPRVDT